MALIEQIEDQLSKLPPREKTALGISFSELTISYPAPEGFQPAIGLRRPRPMSVGDALIAATAIYHNLSLAPITRKTLIGSIHCNSLTRCKHRCKSSGLGSWNAWKA